MSRLRWLACALPCCIGLWVFPNAGAQETGVRAIFEAQNTQGDGGDRSLIVFSVVYFLHDGSFDAFDLGAPASPGVAGVAEFRDGGVMLAAELRASQPDAYISRLEHGLFLNAPELQQYRAREQRLDPAKHRYLSYLAYVFPSDDAFVGNDDPRAHEVFDAEGRFLGPIVIDLAGSSVLDAGTRLNDETDMRGFDVVQWQPQAVTEQEVIRPHPGFNGSVANPQGAPRKILGGTAMYYSALDGVTLHTVDPILGDFTHPSFRSLNRFRLTSGLGPFFSGAWYDRERSGEGFQVMVFNAPTPQVSLTYFTYATDGSGRQRWLTGVGPIDFLSAEVELFETSGGTMASTGNPTAVTSRRWGTATVGFASCTGGGVILQPDAAGEPSGTIFIERLTLPSAKVARDCGPYSLNASDAPPPPF